MPGYAKFWTTMLTDEWFVGLNCNQRGFWMQLILTAKAWGDTGTITFSSWSACAQHMGTERSTCVRCMTKFECDLRIRCTVVKRKFISIEILNYKHWQGLRLQKDGNFHISKCENSPTTIPKQTIPYHTKEETAKPGGSEAVKFWMSEYQDKIGRKYVFTKKDGVNIARIVKAVGLEEFKRMASWIITTSEKWYCDNRSPSIILSKINDIPGLMKKKTETGGIHPAEGKYAKVGK
jgi:hypothetical protein